MNKGKHKSQTEDNKYENDYIIEPSEPSVRIETHGKQKQENILSKYFNPGEKLMAQKTLFVLVILFILVFIFLIILTSLVSIYYSVITSQLKQADKEKAELVSQMRIINQTFEQTCRRCPSGWRLVYSFCYYFSTTPQTWEEAKTSCANTSSTLLIVEDEAEMRALMVIIGLKQYWIGLYRTAPGVNKWKWINGRDLDFNYWLQNEPNNNQGKENCVETCNERLNDYPCNFKVPYICKNPLRYC